MTFFIGIILLARFLRSLLMKHLMGFALILSAIFASPSIFAARDDLQLQMQYQANKKVAAKHSNASSEASQVLPLDHGPRATTTQWLNQQRQLQNQNSSSAAEGK